MPVAIEPRSGPWPRLGALLLASTTAHVATVLSLPSSVRHDVAAIAELVEYRIPDEAEPQLRPPPPAAPPAAPAPPPSQRHQRSAALRHLVPPVESPPESPAPQAPSLDVVVDLTASPVAFGAPDSPGDGATTPQRHVEGVGTAALAPDEPPERMDTCSIDYPDEAKRAGIEGTVTLSITVDEQGHVASASVLSGPGYGLDEAARTALLRCRFKPARRAGKTVPTTTTYRFTFVLE